MKRTMALAVVLLLSGGARAEAQVFQDWSGLKPGTGNGSFTDTVGSSVDVSGAPGPEAGERALKITARIIQWGGAWAWVKVDLSGAGAVAFKARTTSPGLLMVGLMDDKDVQKVARVRVTSGDWEEFVVPLSLFEKTRYPKEGVKKGAELDLRRIASVQFQPLGTGSVEIWIGPLTAVVGKPVGRTGLPSRTEATDRLVVQDFLLLDKTACGPFQDGMSGKRITLDVEGDPDRKGGRVASLSYDLQPRGNCGYWIRCGDVWGGQDWRGAKALSYTVYSTEPLALEFSFNDANQNAYAAASPSTRGAGWETLSIPFHEFSLNKHYKPPEAREGEPLDLSRIDSFNVTPKTIGRHSFKLREVVILKK